MVAAALTPSTTTAGDDHPHRKFCRSDPPTETMGSRGNCGVHQSLTSRYSDWIEETLDEIKDCFLITDPSVAGHPIVFASRGFLAMSGYSLGEVVGRNGRIFQGPATCRWSVMQIREAIREEKPIQISLLNYKKDGTPHWLLFHMFPVFAAEDGRVVHFVAVQVPIPRQRRRSSSSRPLVFGACRNEVLWDEELRCSLVLDSFVDVDNRGLVNEELREASEHEREKAEAAANSILSALSSCSKLTGKVVSGKRCKCTGIKPLSSSLTIPLGRIKKSFVLTDPHLPGMPIVYASDEFLILTGYSEREVLGHNSRFLNGPDTDVEVLHQIKESIQAEKTLTVCLLNYRKDGTSFWNHLHISPVRNATGKIAFFVEVQSDEGAKDDGFGLSIEMRQLGVVGAVKVAVRSSASSSGLSRPST